MNKTYKKNRQELFDEMINENGYSFCQECKKTTQAIASHHIIYRSEKPKHPEIHNKLNLILICSICHDNFHNNKNSREHLIKERNLTELFNL